MKNFKILSILSLLSMTGLSYGSVAEKSKDSIYAPSAFKDQGSLFVPVDITKNEVKWMVSSDLKSIEATARVEFVAIKSGFPMLLLNSNANAKMGSREVKLEKMAQKDFEETNYYGLLSKVKAGESYVVDFNYSFTHNLDDKTFLPVEYYYGKFSEQGIPGNGTFDHYPINLDIQIDGRKEYQVFSNGAVTKYNKGSYSVEFPEYMTSMGVFIDITSKPTLVKSVLTSKIDGRKIPLTVYSDGISKDLEKSMSIKEVVNTFMGILKYKLHEQESFWGSYPFESLTLKISDKEAGTGAFAGAMILSTDYMEDMSHEISHNWFLQSIVPARGEDTWIFEGLGDWAHLYGWRSGFAKDLNMKDSVVLGTGDYKLWANREMFPLSNLRTPHQTGRIILASFDQHIKQSGAPGAEEGIMPVLKELHRRKKYQTITTKEYIDLIEDITGLKGEISKLFNFYSKKM